MADLSKYSAQQLHQLQRDIDKELKSRRKEDAKRAQREMKEVAAKYGLSLEEVLGSKGRTSVPAAAKYRHPTDAKKTWTGRGRKPVWLREWEKAGKPLDDLRVN